MDIKQCSKCGAETSFMRKNKSELMEGEVCTVCDKWLCNDCIDWAVSPAPICDECSQHFINRLKKQCMSVDMDNLNDIIACDSKINKNINSKKDLQNLYQNMSFNKLKKIYIEYYGQESFNKLEEEIINMIDKRTFSASLNDETSKEENKMKTKKGNVDVIANVVIEYAEQVRRDSEHIINANEIAEGLKQASTEYQEELNKEKHKVIEAMEEMRNHINSMVWNLNKIINYKIVLHEYAQEIHDNYGECTESYFDMIKDLEQEDENLKEYIEELQEG